MHGADIQTTEDLLREGRLPAGRNRLSATGISTAMLLEWINHADLTRVNGVGSEYADLLEDAGVDRVAELARRNAANLCGQKGLQRREGSRATYAKRRHVAGWIAEAKTLGRTIEY